MRTWQGIVILVAIAVILCAGLYIFAYKAGYLPLPPYLERFLRLQERTDIPASSGELSRAFFQSIPAKPTETEARLFTPEDTDPAVLFAALATPTEYRQRLRVTEQWAADGEKRYRNVLLYVRGGQARIEKEDEIILLDADAGTCYRGSAVEGSVTPIGKNTLYTELGFPTLAAIQSRKDLTLSFSPETKNITAVYTVDENTWTYSYAIDSGLLMEMRVERDGVRILSMYTDQYAVPGAADRVTRASNGQKGGILFHMNNSGKTQKRRIGVLDVCILVAFVAIIAGVAARYVLRDNSSMAQPKALQNYLVDFEIKNIRGTSEKYLKTDSAFYLDETGDYLGVVYKKEVLSDPAMTEYVTPEGDVVYVPNLRDAGDDLCRIDVTGTFLVSGYVDDNGFFLLNGNRYLGLSKEVAVRSRELMVKVIITDIRTAPASAAVDPLQLETDTAASVAK